MIETDGSFYDRMPAESRKRLMRLNHARGEDRQGYSEALPLTAGDGAPVQLFLRADLVNEPASDVRWIYSIRRVDQEILIYRVDASSKRLPLKGKPFGGLFNSPINQNIPPLS